MEDALIKRVRQGDQRAFQQLVEIYQPVAWRTACALLSDRGAAEDALQEGWLDVWKGLKRYRLDSPFRPWLLVVIANRCRKALRSSHRSTLSLHDMSEGILVDEQSLRLLSRLEMKNELSQAFNQLSEQHRQILELRFFAGLELTEVAMVTHIPLGTAKSRLHRALEALRVQLQTPQLINARVS